MRGTPLTVIGDGRQTRCFTYVEDAIRATVAAGLKEEAVGRIVNVGSDEEVSIKDLAAMMIRISGSRSSVTFVPQQSVYGDSYEDISRRVPDIQRMREILGVTPQVPLEEGLKRTIEWFRRQGVEGNR